MKELIICKEQSTLISKNKSKLYFNSLCFEKNDLREIDIKSKFNSNEYLNGKSLHDIICSYCLSLAMKFNKSIYNNYSETFWIRLYWREVYIIISLIHYYKLKLIGISEKFKKEIIIIKVLEDFSFKNKRETDFINFFNIESQEKLISSILKIEKLKNFKLNIKKYKSNDIPYESSKPNTKKSFYQNFLTRARRSSSINLFHSFLLNLFLMILKPRKKKKFKYKFEFHKWEGYDNLIESLISDDSKKLISKIDEFSKQKFRIGKIILVSNEIYSDLNYKLRCLLGSENGEILVGYQHGGYAYGTMKESIFHSLEYNLDYFLSWGWKHNDYNIVPFASPFWFRKIKPSKKKNNHIILTGTDQPIINYKLDNTLSDKQKREYFKTQIEILKKSSFLKKNNFILYFRPYPKILPYSYKLKDLISNNFNEKNIILKSFHSRLKKISLHIIDHPGTSIPISFHANIPTILIWNPNYYKKYFSDDFKNILAKFKYHNIYFENIDDMLGFVDTHNKESLNKWWNSREIQLVINEYNNMFSKYEKFWLIKLFKILKSL